MSVGRTEHARKKVTMCPAVLRPGGTVVPGGEPREYGGGLIGGERAVAHDDLPTILVTARGKGRRGDVTIFDLRPAGVVFCPF